MVCRWQTVEDGAPRDVVAAERRHEGHVTEHVYVALPVRHPGTHAVMRVALVIRASLVTGEVTAACERVSADDGA